MKQLRLQVALLACLSFIPVQAFAQMSLTQAFAGLHSSDASVRAAANSQIVNAAEKELTTIEKDTTLLCSSLSDPDPYIRQQASGILSVIAQLHPEHRTVVNSCSTALIHSASDTATRVRINSLAALAVNAGGPPQAARPAFAAALAEPSDVYQGLGAFGLLKLGGSDNYQMVANAIRQTTTNDGKIALMHAITRARVGNAALFGVVSNLLYDTNSDVQQAAIDAIGVSAANKAEAVSALQNFAGSSSGSSTIRKAAAARAERLASQSSIQ